MLTQLRFWLIRFLAGDSLVMVNVHLNKGAVILTERPGMVVNCKFEGADTAIDFSPDKGST
jgi:hypothetical protein